mgnify:CR=1 FL=1
MNRRDWLRGTALIAAGVVAADQLDVAQTAMPPAASNATRYLVTEEGDRLTNEHGTHWFAVNVAGETYFVPAYAS